MTDPAKAATAASPTLGAPTTGSPGGTRARRRVPFWDNARFACIVLVVLGHATQRLTYDSDVALGLYLLVYAFHMPAFAIISGYFSKSDPPSRLQMARVVTDILLPYVIFEALWTLTKWIVEGQANPNLTQPSWTLWFLLALGIFRLVLPYLALLRWPLLWTVVISIGAGYLPNLDSTFSLSRTLGLLPFFTLGWWLREHDVVDRFRLLGRRAWWVPVAAVAAFAVAGWAAWFFVDELARDEPARVAVLRRELLVPRRHRVVGGRRAPGAHGHRDRAQRGVLRAAAPAHALVDALRPVHDVRLPAALVRAVPVPRVRRSARSRTHLAVAADRHRRLGAHRARPCDEARQTRVPAARRTATRLAVRRSDARAPRGSPERPDRLAAPARAAPCCRGRTPTRARTAELARPGGRRGVARRRCRVRSRGERRHDRRAARRGPRGAAAPGRLRRCRVPRRPVRGDRDAGAEPGAGARRAAHRMGQVRGLLRRDPAAAPPRHGSHDPGLAAAGAHARPGGGGRARRRARGEHQLRQSARMGRHPRPPPRRRARRAPGQP